MLLSTFLHLKGVSNKTEKRLWNDGVLTWKDYTSKNKQSYLTKELAPPSPLASSFEAHESGNVDFFANSIPKSAFYRIALSYPEETLFLDIETTGLSLYYDIVTLVGWSINGRFEVYINGQKDSSLREALKRAKAIITFNGSTFDLKFLKKHFKSLYIPPVHIDLRYLSKRVGLTGGQKTIESSIGYIRNNDVKGMLGEAAPILWHEYRRGDKDAMKRLIKYNYEDIEGMKCIFDFCVAQIMEDEGIPNEIRPRIRFSDQRSALNLSSEAGANAEYIKIPKFSGSTKPLISYAQLNDIFNVESLVVAGIDLVSSNERESGCCILKGNVAKTCRLRTDEEILDWSLNNNVDLVSIDSPLGIPIGRTSFFDDDPYRHYGIMRECERTLKRRGINVYPCLIPSMQKLTRRGMALAEQFRQKGIPVIESYPGAAQDIMMIPRKQAGHDNLISGIKEFGVNGDFFYHKISHDELDAITSSIVGLFFWAGMFEKLGNPFEEHLIIPDLNANYKTWLDKHIVGFSETQQHTDELRAYLAMKGFVLIAWDELLNNYKDNFELKMRSSNLSKEIDIDINFYKKWSGKELTEMSNDHDRVAFVGINTADDKALLIESFGPSFQMFASSYNFQKDFLSLIKDN